MAKVEAVTITNHVAIRIDDEDEGASSSGSCCAVCMEPSEWVIVGACGHRVVCLYCGVLMRFFQDDRRCCICRAFCATVVITRANSRPLQQVAVDDGGSQRRQSIFPKTSPAFDGLRPEATHYFWYHGGMAAYFEDRAPYEAVKNMCSKTLPLPPSVVGNKYRAPHQDPNEDQKYFRRYLAFMAFVGAAGSIPLVMHYLHHWLPRVAVAIACGLVSAAWAYFDSRRYS